MTGAPELPCGCCAGVHVATPAAVANRPGLDRLRYRVGTHGSFLSSMLARLSAAEFPGLARLTTRDPADPAIALLDAWATIADVLTFYQERIANEGFLRTAVERRSVVELARLVGYEPRPGVAAATHLALELEPGYEETIAEGTRVRSVPGPGELPQVFETSEPLPAKAAFNRLGVRLTRPQVVTKGTAAGLPTLWFQGTGLRLAANDAVLIVVGERECAHPFLRFVDRVEEDFEAKRTLVHLQLPPSGRQKRRKWWTKHLEVDALIEAVVNGAPAPTRVDARVPIGEPFDDTALRLAQVMHPGIKDVLYKAWSKAVVSKPDRVRVYAMRVRAPLFGSNAPDIAQYKKDGKLEDVGMWFTWKQTFESGKKVYLDAAYPGVRTGSILALHAPGKGPLVYGLDPTARIEVDVVTRNAYGLAGKASQVTLDGDDWIAVFGHGPNELDMEQYRSITAYGDNEPLELAEEPITTDVCRANLELDGLYEGLAPGRVLVVTGERADIPGVTGITEAELVEVADVRQAPVGEHGAIRPGDRHHTFLVLARGGLRHCYVRDTVQVYGNVVHATHGETKAEVLGSGDARSAHQAFTLRSAPVTRVSAPTPTGIETELEVRVDDVLWPRWPWFVGRGPAERGYVIRTDDEGVTMVVAPNGVEGRRLPTGAENVRARYRVGLGPSGNVAAGSLTQFVDKPLSLRGVVNPLRATGGADAETTDDARSHAALPIKALDRLVSVVDYADFARTFAGVGKATAHRVSDGRRQVVLVTVAGAGGIELTSESDVVVNLRRALRRFGDPSMAVRVLVANRLVLRLTANVGIDADREWPVVEARVRAALLERYSFGRQELGADVAESDVLATVHKVPGVRSVRLDHIDSTPAGGLLPKGYSPAERVVAQPARREAAGLLPADHLYLAPELPEFLLLREARP